MDRIRRLAQSRAPIFVLGILLMLPATWGFLKHHWPLPVFVVCIPSRTRCTAVWPGGTSGMFTTTVTVQRPAPILMGSQAMACYLVPPNPKEWWPPDGKIPADWFPKWCNK